jgi:hypothetical protein
MGAVITRRVRTSQPSGCVIAAPEWRALGLQNLTMFGTADIDAASPAGFTRSGTGHVLKAGRLGVGVSQNGGNNTWALNAKGKTIGVGNQFAVVIAFQLNATGQTQRYLVMDGASADQAAVIYGYVANTVEFFAQGYTGSDPRTGSGIVVNDTLPHVIIYTYDGTNWRGYLDGVEKFSVTRTFSLFGLAGTASGFIGGATATTGVSNATYYLHARFSAGLPRTAALRLSANPWQMFKPQLRRIWAAGMAQATTRRALIISNGQITQIVDALVGTNQKPLVLYLGKVQQQVASEGVPIVIVNGVIRTLASNETLIL